MAIDANSRARSFLRSGSSVQKNDIGLNVFNEFRVRVYKEKTIKKMIVINYHSLQMRRKYLYVQF